MSFHRIDGVGERRRRTYQHARGDGDAGSPAVL
jgi:hypothetical protein